MTEPLLIAGPWFEDFHVGLEFDAPAVTLTGGHAAMYAALFGDRLRLPLDHATSARVTGAAAPLAHPLLAINTAIGQSTWASQRVKANLFYRGLELLRPPRIGDTLATRTRVVGLRQNRPQPGRPATGVVALEITTTNQHGEAVLHFWRCPMIPCRDPEARTGHADDLDAIGAAAPAAQLAARLPGRELRPTDAWLGRRARNLVAGQRFAIEARDTVTSAPELVRLSLNMAMAHTDARLSYLGDRLVYGGHVVFTAFAQLTRALPNLLTVLAWDSCDHTAPVVEGDRLRTMVTVVEALPQARGALLKLGVETWAARGPGHQETETRVLDWTLWAWSA
jgi:2-methylfumaryl-CoA hydratase